MCVCQQMLNPETWVSVRSELCGVAPETWWGKYLPLPEWILCWNTNHFANIAHNCQYAARWKEFLWRKQGCLLIPTDPAILCPPLVGTQWQLVIPARTKTFPPGLFSSLACVGQRPSPFITISRTKFKMIQGLSWNVFLPRQQGRLPRLGRLWGWNLQHLDELSKLSELENAHACHPGAWAKQLKSNVHFLHFLQYKLPWSRLKFLEREGG